MYNQNQKEEFLNYYKTVKPDKSTMLYRAESVLSSIEKYEKKWEMDFCEQTDHVELQKVATEFSTMASGPLDGRIIVLREYCKWCKDREIPNASLEFLKIKVSNDKIAEKMFGSPLELQIHLNKLFQPENLKNIHNVYRAFVWLAFIGFAEKECIDITCDDVDLNSMIISHNDSVFSIYSEALQCINNCKNLKTFNYSHPLYKDKTVDRERADGNLLLRGFGSDPKESPYYKLNAMFSRSQTNAFRDGKITKRATYHSVWLSGIFYRAFQQEQQGSSIDFFGVAVRHWLNIPKQVANSVNEFNPEDESHQKRVSLFVKSFEKDYKRWKKVFYNV